MDVLLHFMHKTAQSPQASVSPNVPILNLEIQQQEHVYPNVYQDILEILLEMALQQVFTYVLRYALNSQNTVTHSQDYVLLKLTVQLHTFMLMISQDNVLPNALQLKTLGVIQLISSVR